MSKASVRIIPLGGLGEIGKNITVIESSDGILIVDCGITFPREEGHFGVDIILPDFTYLEQHRDRILGVVLTHPHEDHIGAIPYLLREIGAPQVLGTRFTLALAKSKADEAGLLTATEWIEVDPDHDPVNVAGFELEFVRVAHSVPDGVAVAITTDAGRIFHTGDLKLDPAPLDAKPTDLGHIAEIGADGIDLYLADSTQADVPGQTPSERTLSGPLRDICSKAPGRIIAACFSSHIHRIQQFIDIATETNRSVCILGRSMTRNTNIAKNLGYLDADGVRFLKPQQVNDHEAHEVMILCTGSQGEPLAALNRISHGTHPHVSPSDLDTVIFSSRTIPGNETRVHRIQNALAKVGAHIYSSDNATVHVSGHASSAELTTMLQLTRPKFFMPVHGEWRHLRAHADLARMLGMSEDNILLAENGFVIELTDGVARVTNERVPVGARLVDRNSNDEIIEEILEERQQVSGEGLVVVVAHEATQRLEVITRGFVADEQDEILETVQNVAESVLESSHKDNESDAELSIHLQQAVERALDGSSRRSPLVVPIVLLD